MNSTPTLKQIAQGFLGLLLLIGLVWLTFYALIFVLIIAGIATVWFVAKRFLQDQGVIKPSAPPTPPGMGPDVTVIETEYQDVTEEKKDA